MLYVALAEAVVLFVVCAVGASLVRSLIRQHARREDLLLNQMLNLAGKPWQPAPSDEGRLEIWQQKLDEAREVRRSWTVNPEQEI